MLINQNPVHIWCQSIVQIYYLHHNGIQNLIYHQHMLQMILHLSQVQILINIYNMPQHLLSICTGCKYSCLLCEDVGVPNWVTLWEFMGGKRVQSLRAMGEAGTVYLRLETQ
jgi:hypothetical protein